MRIEGWRGLIKSRRFVWRCGFIESAIVPLGVQLVALSAIARGTGSCRRCDVPSASACLVVRGAVERHVESADWHGSLTHVCVAGVGECSRRLRYRLNPEHSAHLCQTGEWSLFSRVKTYDLGDGATKSCGGRTLIDHASDSITPWMNSGDACDGPLGWRRKLVSNEHQITHVDWRILLSPFLSGLQRSKIVR